MISASVKDDIFAQLTELFGDILSAEIILDICKTTSWQLNESIEKLIKHIENNEQIDLETNSIYDLKDPDDVIGYDAVNRFQNLNINHSNQLNGELRNFDQEDDLVIESEEILNCEPPEVAPTKFEFSIAAPQFYPQQQGAVKKSKFPFIENWNVNETSKGTTFASLMTTDQGTGGNGGRFFDQQPINKQPRYASPERKDVQQIIADIQRGLKIMILMRGVPGSGKTHLAREIIDKTMQQDHKNHIFSADDYFYNRQNRYVYNRNKVADAHEFNQTRVRHRCTDGWSPIFVDNTHSEVWEMYVYVRMAVDNGYLLRILEPNTRWARSAGRLAVKNSHNVPKDKIEKMLLRYQSTSVEDMFQTLHLSYPCEMPQMRKMPALPSVNWQCALGDCSGTTGGKMKKVLVSTEPVWNEDWNAVSSSSNREKRSITAPRVERTTNKFVENSDEKRNMDYEKSYTPPLRPVDRSLIENQEINTFEIARQKIEDLNNEWTSFEKERIEFWKQTKSPTEPLINVPNIEQTQKERTETNILSILKDNVLQPKEIDENTSVKQLRKHQKGCLNENTAFAQIRQIYPTVPLAYLWDLFKKCNGDADWTMDILLKEETRVADYQGKQGENNFECQCDRENENVAVDLPIPIPIQIKSNETKSRRMERQAHQFRDDIQTVKKIIEENCTISDEHYSDHVRKIRNLRHGIGQQPSPSHLVTVTGSGYIQDDADGAQGATALPHDDEPLLTGSSSDQQSDEDGGDELLEINLGTELIQQLDSVFGVNAFQKDSICDLKTNVFMPKELAQQLYALWMESLFHQVEEQRQQSIKEDEEFARSLQAQQTFPDVRQPQKKPIASYKDILEMESAWAAYNAKVDKGWSFSRKEDLATYMTRAKLCEMFPGIDSDTLQEMLQAHGNKFDETVDVLRKSLNQNVASGSLERALLEKAKLEMEKVPKDIEMLNCSSATSSVSQQRALELKKLGPDEAKKAALADFEECRNLAMHYTQLKSECYRKAQELIQRDTATALYYSQIANLHKTKVDMYNQRAANAIMEVHNLTQNNPDMLDLHYLHALEAVQCLDIFLDKHLNKLKMMNRNAKCIFVITGRGLHSTGGVATIKSRVKRRLRERQLTWIEVNPGLLKIKMYGSSRFSNS